MGIFFATITVRELHLLDNMRMYTHCIKNQPLHYVLFTWCVLVMNKKNKNWNEPSARTRLFWHYSVIYE